VDLGLDGRVVVIDGPDTTTAHALAALLRDEGAHPVLLEPGEDLGAVLADDGRVDAVVVLVGDPGSGHADRLLTDVDTADELFAAWTPVTRAVDLYTAALPSMLGRGWGRFVAVVSDTVKELADGVDDLEAVVGLGILGMQKSAGADVAGGGVVVNTVLRGPHDPPADVAAVVAFYLSDGAGYCQGTTISLTGATARNVF
jgi:hypothetical protein